jgi:hypothetical protein
MSGCCHEGAVASIRGVEQWRELDKLIARRVSGDGNTMAGLVIGRGRRNEFRDGVGDSKGVLTGVTCRSRSKSEFKEKGVDYQIQRSLFFPRSKSEKLWNARGSFTSTHHAYSVS